VVKREVRQVLVDAIENCPKEQGIVLIKDCMKCPYFGGFVACRVVLCKYRR